MMADRGVIAVLDSKEFTLYDNEDGLFISTSSQEIHHTAETHDVTFDFYTEGTSLVPARIYQGSSIIGSDFNLSSNQRTTKTVNHAPDAGSSYTYSLRVWNGNAWIVSSYYVVDRISNTDYAPPVITLVGTNPQSVDLNATYQELGATINSAATVSINATAVNTSSVGTYIVTYNADGAAQVTRTVNVVSGNTSPPGDNGGNPLDNIN
jgi:ketopantoate hydroxymethyltransferase